VLNNIYILNLNNNNPVHIQTTRRTQSAVTQFWTWIRIKVTNKIDYQINANDKHLKNCNSYSGRKFIYLLFILKLPRQHQVVYKMIKKCLNYYKCFSERI